MNQNVREIRERCKTKTETEARKEVRNDEERQGGRCCTREVR